MNPSITITEVFGRAVQGMTKPFLCKAGFFDYYVKGAYAGLDSLCCEWVANRLVNLALPSAPLGVPMFEMGEVPRALIEESGFPDIRELGAGRVFASLRIEDGQELRWSAAQGMAGRDDGAAAFAGFVYSERGPQPFGTWGESESAGDTDSAAAG